jgi:hypothetical protein
VRLLDLTRLWPTRAGVSTALSSGPRPRARAWARAIYVAYSQADGVWYGSSMHSNSPCVALFERANDALALRPDVHRALADATLRSFLANVAADLNFHLIA